MERSFIPSCLHVKLAYKIREGKENKILVDKPLQTDIWKSSACPQIGYTHKLQIDIYIYIKEILQQCMRHPQFNLKNINTSWCVHAKTIWNKDYSMSQPNHLVNSHEPFLSVSAIRSTSLAIEENDWAVSCISLVFKLMPCPTNIKFVKY